MSAISVVVHVAKWVLYLIWRTIQYYLLSVGKQYLFHYERWQRSFDNYNSVSMSVKICENPFKIKQICEMKNIIPVDMPYIQYFQYFVFIIFY